MSRRIPVKLLITLLGVLLLSGVLVGCGGSGDEAQEADIPDTPDGASNTVVRVSGTSGTAYLGDYGNVAGELNSVEDTLGDEPTEYNVKVQQGSSDGITAFFQKTESGKGELKVTVLADDKVVAESRTYAERGTVVADWSPQSAANEAAPGGGPSPDQTLPDEPPPQDITNGEGT